VVDWEVDAESAASDAAVSGWAAGDLGSVGGHC
jgi:hypothetical protein